MNLHDKYPTGRKYRVIKEGAVLSGWKPSGHPYSFNGWQRSLRVGEVIETAGFIRGWGSDPGYGVHFKEPGMGNVEFYPSSGGIFSFEPAEGFLEPVEGEGEP